MNHDPIGIIEDTTSVYFCGPAEKPSYSLSEIYRTIAPAEQTNDIFEMTAERIRDYTKYDTRFEPGNVFVSFLLTEISIEMTDDEITNNFLSAGCKAIVRTLVRDDRHYRIIIIRENGEQIDYPQYVFMQMWDDAHIWAQPLAEKTTVEAPVAEDQIALITDAKGRDLLILAGILRESRRINNYCATAWICEDDIWAPANWLETFDVAGEYDYLPFDDGFIGYVCDDNGEYLKPGSVYLTVTKDGEIIVVNPNSHEEMLRFTPKK